MSQYTKYPRTPHLPWSRGATPDDIRMDDDNPFWLHGGDVVVSEKLDGESCSMYCDHIHARSMDSLNHPSREWVKRLHGEISWQIPRDMKICGENVYGKHSIGYDELTSFFYVFGICEWNEKIGEYMFLSWDDTEEWTKMLGLKLVPVLYKGIPQWKDLHKKCWTRKSAFGGEQEGYVVRIADSFMESEFENCVAKFVRKNHVQTDQFWMKTWTPNKLLAKD